MNSQPKFSLGFDVSALDPNFKSHAGRGIGRYVSELKRYFDTLPASELEIKYFDHHSLRLKSPLGRAVEGLIDRIPLGQNTIRQQIFYPAKLCFGATKDLQVLHFPAHMDPPSLGLKPYIVTVLDLIPFILKESYSAGKSAWRYHFARWLELKAIMHADLILAISECTARDIQRLLGINAERIVVAPLGVDQRFSQIKPLSADEKNAVRSKYAIPQDRPLLLYVGGIDPRKNFRCLLESLKICIERSSQAGINPPLLCMAGKIQSDREYPALLKMIEQLNLASSVMLPGYISDRDLLDLLAISDLFHFPSLYEGFGLPPLEAMAAGLPVVCSNSSSLPEVVGSAALLVEPGDYLANAQAIISILSDRELNARLRALGPKQASKFTWDKTGEATINAYNQFARKSSIRGR